MKGIILAGGTGSRLFPTTLSTNKHLLPIYDKPMIFYPLSVLMLADIKDILIITTGNDQERFHSVLKDGQDFGLTIQYAVQENPRGIADAINIGRKFIGKENVALILGDNIFYGQGFVQKLKYAKLNLKGATIFGYQVNNPEQFGVVEFDDSNTIKSLKEKPKNPNSKWVATGLYMYDNSVIERIKNLKPSNRGELEITDLNNFYLEQNNLKCELLGRGFAWLDAGTPDNLLEASEFVRTLERRQGFKIACLEEIALNKGWVSKESILERISLFGESNYAKLLKTLIDNN